MAILALCLATVASSLSSCGFFTDAYLSEYTLGEEHTRDVLDDDTSRRYPETTQAPNTETPSTETLDTSVLVTTTPTTTVPITTQPPETDNVPDEFDSHVYVQSKDEGRCEEMVGEVIVTVLVLNDRVSSWDGDSKAELVKSLSGQKKELEAGAAAYGKSLSITFSYIDVSITLEATPEDEEDLWIDNAFKAAGFSGRNDAQRELDMVNGADANPVMLALNKDGRAYANQRIGSSGTELVVVFSADLTSFTHELCHVFGAEDFYYPEEVDELAQKYLTDSVMNSGETIDPLTAFLIGWDDELDDKAYKFLDETKHLTAEYLNEENEKQMYTGQVTDYKLKYGTYTGYLLMGVAHGEGKFIYNNGNYFEGTFDHGSWQKGSGKAIYDNGSYEGQFLNNERHGTGTYTWDDGNIYTGDWLNGERTGKGTYTMANGYIATGEWVNGLLQGYAEVTYADGATYEGYYVDGLMHGKGTYMYPNGDIYTGDWAEGKRNGKGTFTWINGDSYTGDWVNEKRTGSGTYVLANGDEFVGDFVDDALTGTGVFNGANGDYFEGTFKNGIWQTGSGKKIYSNGVYVGGFLNGNCDGEGTYAWNNGNKYTGSWTNGSFDGYGTYEWAAGDKYAGDWEMGNRTGQGTYTWANGSVYTGAWLNGNRTGYGTMKQADGASYEGYWQNNKRHGYGKYISSTGKVYDGQWENDKFKS